MADHHTAENDTPPAGFHCAEAKAWHDNYDGMFWRWVECDTERLALKEALTRAELRLRIAEQDAEFARVIPPGTGDTDA